MRRFALSLLVMCVQICVCVSARAQAGSSCTSPIPFGKNYSATISGPCAVWYMGNTFDLPLTVKFYPENNSDKAPELNIGLRLTARPTLKDTCITSWSWVSSIAISC